ncbi:MAG: hypothetical protein AAF211_18865, partial [Myxococcota bacterium]
EAYRTAYRARGGDVWVGAKLPGVMAHHAAEVRVLPHVMTGRPDDAVWRWFERFALEHLDTLVGDGHLAPGQAEAFRAVWAEVSTDRGAVFFSPYNVVVAAQRPADG